MNQSLDFKEVIRLLGFQKPTPVQEAAIPLLHSGKSAVVLAPTGSGKTLAFLYPLMTQLGAERQNIQVLILAPTRELGAQIAQSAERLAEVLAQLGHPRILVRTAFGGQPIAPQIEGLACKPQILVGTPGRVLDLKDRGILQLQFLRAIVVDEADHLLHLGFEAQMAEICRDLSHESQFVLFSATQTSLSSDLFESLTKNVPCLDLREGSEGGEVQTLKIRHEYLVADDYGHKEATLLKFLKEYDDQIPSAILFCRTREEVAAIGRSLHQAGFSAESISGQLGQVERTSIMRRFKSHGFRFLVATNIAARGIHVDKVALVINFDLPSLPEEYTHRAGRSGRAGHEGWVVSLLTRSTLDFYLELASAAGFTPKELSLSRTKSTSPVRGSASQAKTAGVRLAKLHLNRGKSSKLRPGDIVGALTQKFGFSPNEIGNIFIFDHFSHLEVSAQKTKSLLESEDLKIKNIRVKVAAIQASLGARQDKPKPLRPRA